MELSPTLVKLNVGGRIFQTTQETLKSLPNTRLGKIASRKSSGSPSPDMELFFDRNPKIVDSLLDLYRTGELHLPKDICYTAVQRELEFWDIPSELIHDCCWEKFESHQDMKKLWVEIKEFMRNESDESDTEVEDVKETLSLRRKMWITMDNPRFSTTSKIWSGLYFTIVLLSVVTFALETVPSLRTASDEYVKVVHDRNLSVDTALKQLGPIDFYKVTVPNDWLMDIQIFVYCFFTAEILIRLMLCPNKRRFLRGLSNLFDIFLLIHGGVVLFLQHHVNDTGDQTDTAEANFLLVSYALLFLRVIRVLYLAKNFDTMKILLLSIKSCGKELLLLSACIFTVVTLHGAAIFIAELFTRETTFSSVPAGMWWAIITMTTVGYGDVYPVGTVGKIVGSVVAFEGLLFMALPAAVLVTRFSAYHGNTTALQHGKERATFLFNNPLFRARPSAGSKGEAMFTRTGSSKSLMRNGRKVRKIRVSGLRSAMRVAHRSDPGQNQ